MPVSLAGGHLGIRLLLLLLGTLVDAETEQKNQQCNSFVEENFFYIILYIINLNKSYFWVLYTMSRSTSIPLLFSARTSMEGRKFHFFLNIFISH